MLIFYFSESYMEYPLLSTVCVNGVFMDILNKFVLVYSKEESYCKIRNFIQPLGNI